MEVAEVIKKNQEFLTDGKSWTQFPLCLNFLLKMITIQKGKGYPQND